MKEAGHITRILSGVTVLALIAGTGFFGHASAVHEDLPLVFTESVAGHAAWGIRVDLAAPTDIQFEILGHAPRTSGISGAAVVTFHENLSYRSMFAATGFTSTDRTIVTLNEEPPTLAGASATVALPGEGVVTTTNAAAGKKECTLRCLEYVARDAGPGSFFAVLWLGGADRVDLRISADHVEDVVVKEGTAWVVDDAEVEGGDTNVQVQRSTDVTDEVTATAGAKAMRSVTFDVDAEDPVYGVWALADFKRACQYRFGLCVSPDLVLNACDGALAETSCRSGEISWTGPAGEGRGSSNYIFRGASSGDYAFTVDAKADAYATGVYEPVSGTYVTAGEHHSALSVAAVGLPVG